MKKFLVGLILALSVCQVLAANPDSLAYQLQRTKINNLLAQRADKFSQYTESLSTKTGIFGLQTKKDIRRSSDILMDIAHTDEVIFKEIKVLLDFKTYQQTQAAQVVAQSHESDDRVLSYMATINKLRQQNEKLQLEQAQQANEFRQKQAIHIIVILLLIAASIFLFLRQKPVSKA